MPRIISRAEGGLVREPPLSRSKVVRPTGWVLTHYTGGGGSVTDGKSDTQHMAELAAYARNNGKEWEYNYVITAPLGWIWEMAGVYRGAHCQNFNEQSLAVQMNLGVGAAPNQAMIDSHRWLREELQRTGQWRPQPASEIAGRDGNVPHYRFRSTACCGGMMAGPTGRAWASPTGEGTLGNLLDFMIAPYSQLPPPSTGDDDVAMLLRSTDGTAAQQETVFSWSGVSIVQWTKDNDMRSIGVVGGVFPKLNGADPVHFAYRRPASEIQALINTCWGGPRGQAPGNLNGYTIPADPAVDPAIKARDNAANALVSVGPDLKGAVALIPTTSPPGSGASPDQVKDLLGRQKITLDLSDESATVEVLPAT